MVDEAEMKTQGRVFARQSFSNGDQDAENRREPSGLRMPQR
ncbi:MAG: hypothetical protein ABIP85_14610 [Chthoniobacteraceae bacterium]